MMTDGLINLVAMFAPPPAPDRVVDWADTERRLGRPVPDDYKELIAAFGPADFCDQVDLFLPQQNPNADIARVTTENVGFLTDQTSAGERPTLTPDGQPFDAAHVIQWAQDAGGGYWLWYPDPSAPDDPTRFWIVFTPADQTLWQFFTGPTTDFLYRFVTGAEPSPGEYGNIRETLGDDRPYVDLFDEQLNSVGRLLAR